MKLSEIIREAIDENKVRWLVTLCKHLTERLANAKVAQKYHIITRLLELELELAHIRYGGDAHASFKENQKWVDNERHTLLPTLQHIEMLFDKHRGTVWVLEASSASVSKKNWHQVLFRSPQDPGHKIIFANGHAKLEKELEEAWNKYRELKPKSLAFNRIKRLYDHELILRDKNLNIIDLKKIPPKIKTGVSTIDNPAVKLSSPWAGSPQIYPGLSPQMRAMYVIYQTALLRNGYEGLTVLYGGEGQYGTVFVVIGAKGKFVWYKRAAYMSTNVIYINGQRMHASAFTKKSLPEQDALLKQNLR